MNGSAPPTPPESPEGPDEPPGPGPPPPAHTGPWPAPDSLRSAIDKAWWDIHHSRDQTWKALQIVVAMMAGMIAIDWQLTDARATLAAGALVIVAAVFGISVAYRHRRQVEEPQIKVIRECERLLGIAYLYREMHEPRVMRWWDTLVIWRSSVSLFIMRMQIVLVVFACIYMGVRHEVGYPPQPDGAAPAATAPLAGAGTPGPVLAPSDEDSRSRGDPP
jgi:hypothetical protein